MNQCIFSGSYPAEDVVFLLKDISNLIVEQDNEFRENAIQSGIHYSEMLPIEYTPSKEYMDIFYNTLEGSKIKLASLVSVLSHKIIEARGKNIVLVSLARAGTPIGILIKRYIQFKYDITIPHYSISIIRDKGIDKNALAHILQNHPCAEIQFIDGWTGKGVIQHTLTKACKEIYKEFNINLNPNLAVLSDPAHCTLIYGTREDFLIPSACLNSTVSGLVSRTVLNDNYISSDDFHGTKFYSELKSSDVSNFYIDEICNCFNKIDENYLSELLTSQNTSEIAADIEFNGEHLNCKGLRDIESIKNKFNIDNINLIKPGIGETTRVLLRRIPWKILVDSFDNPNLLHIFKLAEEKHIPVEIYSDMCYSSCGIIKSSPAEL
ncbi:cysteine protease StiP family protein [Clostridium tagluense]|uniref:cysteine protease StiP family protein n=1 Tax=Clostridium tagluense TaxID=360422 RepID=UPI001C0DE14A|nr:cysteine protease StiP family protein [Clostridium tagluense]MBU3130031.1 cysteine protease StiP family protein [Clostridium tagluense]MBW9158831.1 cysteine protease StiP family protein [Clostridium tagluense]MCB2313506.1 cysteine protease StiP family protein [Clostridium tagluense]MCB2318330.1 cysteine protease StiP family protein [Clostridium tagluense]MCB2323112.1 cysteine protease StiP family protein [Clostridium tagluense]